jgi:DNA-directed RNA polymerase specialized sigma24 family protein
MEPKDLNTPDLLFDRAWAINVLTEATAKLRKVFAESMNEDAFDHLSEFLPLGANDTAYRKIASRMGVKENSVRLQVRRMRQSYRRIIEEYIAKTVGPTAAAEELQHLMAVVRTPLSGDL